MAAGLVCASLIALVYAGAASAHIVNPRTYNGVFPAGSFNGTGSVPATGVPWPNNMQQVAIDQATGNVYATNSNAGRLYKFDESGVAKEFSFLAPNTNFAQQVQTFGDMFVDNSGGAGGAGEGEQGRIYAWNTDEGSPINAYKPSGQPVGGNFPLTVSSNCAGDMAPGKSGKFWIAQYFLGKVIQFNSAGVPTGKEFSTPEPCGLAIDSNENFYPIQYNGPVRKYDSSGTLIGIFDGDPTGGEKEVTVDLSNDHVFVDHRSFINEFDSAGGLLNKFGEKEIGFYEGLQNSGGLAVRESNHKVYAGNNRLLSGSRWVDTFIQLPPSTVPDVTTEAPSVTPTTATLKGVVDQDVPNGGSKIEKCEFQWGPTTNYGNFANCVPGVPLEGHVSVTAEIGSLTKGATYHVRLTAKNENGIQSNGADITFKPSGPPIITEDIASEPNTDSFKLSAKIDPNGGDTKYHFEFGSTTGYGTNLPEPEGEIPSGPAKSVSVQVPGLNPDTEYHFRLVASNFGGPSTTTDHPLHTFALNPSTPDLCSNAQVRQQTGASLLLDCRAYELASAVNTGGYDVQSDLIPGQLTLQPQPGATDRVLYSVHFGTIPNTGEPTNHGLDPYVATRGASGWTTKYVGIDAGGPPPNPEPFGSPLADSSAGLSAFAFGGEGLCNPCFGDGSSGIPVRLPNGSLVQGMKGKEFVPDPTPSGTVMKPLSADGSHLVFGSTQKFESDGLSGGPNISIYDRNLNTGTTHVASKTPGGTTMDEPGIAELDVSDNGTRILIGKAISTDEAGNTYWHLYMNVGDAPQTIDLTPGASSGVLFDGMTADGSRVYFTTPDKLLGSDEDLSADLYRADVGASSSTLGKITNTNYDGCTPVAGKEGPYWNTVSLAVNCDAVGLAGGAGVASADGSVYFLSPEELGGGGEENEANLYIARPPSFSPEPVRTLDPINPAVTNAVYDNEVHRFTDFQVTASGDDAVLTSTRSLTGFQNQGHVEVYHYNAPTESFECASCAITGVAATGDALLADGLNVTNGGTVFFTTAEPLVLRDTNHKKDVYEWKEGKQQLVSTGISDFDSGLLSISTDGTNAFFYTRATLVPQDENGNLMKVYDARAGGGFLVFAPPPLCAASDECHGAGTQSAPPPPIGSYAGSGGNVQPSNKKCKKGYVKKHGRCVKKKKKKKHSGKPKHHSTRRPG